MKLKQTHSYTESMTNEKNYPTFQSKLYIEIIIPETAKGKNFIIH